MPVAPYHLRFYINEKAKENAFFADGLALRKHTHQAGRARFQTGFDMGQFVGYAIKAKRTFKLYVESDDPLLDPLVNYINVRCGYSAARKAPDQLTTNWLNARSFGLTNATPLVFTLLNEIKKIRQLAIVDFENVTLMSRNNTEMADWLRYDAILPVLGVQCPVIKLPSSFWQSEKKDTVITVPAPSANNPSLYTFHTPDKPIYLQPARIAQGGSDVLDMHLAFYLGIINQLFSDIDIHIVSKDTDYHPLVHLMQSGHGWDNRINQLNPETNQYLIS